MNTNKEPTLHYTVWMWYYWNTSDSFDGIYAQSDKINHISRNPDSWKTLLYKEMMENLHIYLYKTFVTHAVWPGGQQ